MISMHWTITFLSAWELKKNTAFREGALRAADYLCGKEARPFKAAFQCRPNGEGKTTLVNIILGLLAPQHIYLSDDTAAFSMVLQKKQF